MRRTGTMAGLVLGAVGLLLFAVASAGADEPATHAFEADAIEFAIEQDGAWYTVRIHMLFESGATPEDQEAARVALKARFPDAVYEVPGSVSGQYTKTGPKWEQGTTDWWYNAKNRPASVNDHEQAFLDAVEVWNVAGANFSFTGGQATDATTGACDNDRDSQNTVGWKAQPGAILAITCTWSTRNGGGSYTEFDMEIDPAWSWTTSDTSIKSDLVTVLAHEFGHALGLAHTQQKNCPGTLMCGSYFSGKIGREPEADDLEGLYALYGQAQAAPTATATVVPPTPKPNPDGLPRGPFQARAAGAARQ